MWDFAYWWSCVGKGLRAACEAGFFIRNFIINEGEVGRNNVLYLKLIKYTPCYSREGGRQQYISQQPHPPAREVMGK